MKKTLIFFCLFLIISMAYTQSETMGADTLDCRRLHCHCIFLESVDTLYTDLIDQEVKARIEIFTYYHKGSDILQKSKLTIWALYDYKTTQLLHECFLEFEKDTSKYNNLLPLLEEYAYNKMSRLVIIRKEGQKREKKCLIIPLTITVYLFPKE